MNPEHSLWLKSYEFILNTSVKNLCLIKFIKIEVYSLKHLKHHQVNEVQMIVNLSRENAARTQSMVEIL